MRVLSKLDISVSVNVGLELICRIGSGFCWNDECL